MSVEVNALRAGFVRAGILHRRAAYRLDADEVESVRCGLRKNWPRWPSLPRTHQRALGSFRTMCGRFAKDVAVAAPDKNANCKRCAAAQLAGWCRAASKIFQMDEEEFTRAGYTRRAGLRR